MTTTLRPYDYWAIEYASKPIGGDEKAELQKIASRCADPMVPYSTDEDALGTYSPASIDPLANQYDASDDPLAYFKGRVKLVDELWSGMEKRLAKPGEGYQVYRRAMRTGRSVGSTSSRSCWSPAATRTIRCTGSSGTARRSGLRTA